MTDTIPMKRAIVFLNGELLEEDKFYKEFIKDDDDIYCADGGAMHTYKLGKIPIEIIGDMDSVSKDVLVYYENKKLL